MQVSTFWAETAKGPTLYIALDGRKVAFLETDLSEQSARVAALSLWEGIAGPMPSGRFRRWHWRRDLHRGQRGIQQVIVERGAYSAS